MTVALQPASPDLVRLPSRGEPAVHPAGTPYLDLDVAAAVTRYRRLGAALPGTAVHYAVKANPRARPAGRAWPRPGSRFDVASPAEVVAALEAGAGPGDLVYSNPVKRRADVAFAARLGVRLFVVDSLEETHKVAAAAPGSSVLCRIVHLGRAARTGRCPASSAAPPHEAVARAPPRRRLGLDAAGVSFHVGSQQRDPSAWDAPIAASARVFAALRRRGRSQPWLLDLGGGFPAASRAAARRSTPYGAAIERSLRRHFGSDRPRTIVEPGRPSSPTPGRW